MSKAQATTEVPRFEMRHRLALALESSGVTVQEMADHLGVTRNTVGNYLHGRTLPSRSTQRDWAMRCGVPFDWLSGGENGEAAEAAADRRKARKARKRTPGTASDLRNRHSGCNGEPHPETALMAA